MIASRLAAAAASYGEVIRRPRYVPLWLGQLVSNFGDTLHLHPSGLLSLLEEELVVYDERVTISPY